MLLSVEHVQRGVSSFLGRTDTSDKLGIGHEQRVGSAST